MKCLPCLLWQNQLGVSERWCHNWVICTIFVTVQVRIQREGQGVRTPPGKSQVTWVSIENKQLDPPWKSWTPPGKCWTPSGTLKNDRFLWNWPFDFCKMSWGLKNKQKNVVPLTEILGSAHAVNPAILHCCKPDVITKHPIPLGLKWF